MRILLFGSDGQVGWELRRSLSILGEVVPLTRREADLRGPVAPLVASYRPQVVVNAAAYTAVDRAESEPDLAQRVNAEAVGEMAQAAARIRALFVHYSTDYVFDGALARPYTEADTPHPLNAYGRSKLAGEEAVLEACAGGHLLFRTSWVYSARGRNFARTILERARRQDRLQVVADAVGTPTSAELIADVTASAVRQVLLGDEAAAGLYHLVPAGSCSWHDYAVKLLQWALAAGITLRAAPEGVEPVGAASLAAAARRPANSRLDNALLQRRFGLHLPPWELHAQRFVDALAHHALSAAA